MDGNGSQKNAIVVAGHAAIDLVIDYPGQEKPRVALGGGVSYSSLVLSSLGYPAQIVTKVGYDFPRNWSEFLKKNTGVDLESFRLPSERTTSFRIDRSLEPRKMWLLARCKELEARDFGDPAKSPRDTLILNPIAGEISLSLLDRISKEFDFVLVDSQGFVRRFSSKTAEVSLRSGLDISSLSGVDLLKADRQELCAWSGTSDVDSSIRQVSKFVDYVLVPSGGETVVLYENGKPVYTVHPHRAQVSDTTGAGDIMLAVFAATFSKTRDVKDSLLTSISAANLSVEKSGIEKAIIDGEALALRRKRMESHLTLKA